MACGRFDGIAAPANSAAIASRITGSELRTYEGGHAFLAQDPRAATDVVEFLRDRGIGGSRAVTGALTGRLPGEWSAGGQRERERLGDHRRLPPLAEGGGDRQRVGPGHIPLVGGPRDDGGPVALVASRSPLGSRDDLIEFGTPVVVTVNEKGWPITAEAVSALVMASMTVQVNPTEPLAPVPSLAVTSTEKAPWVVGLPVTRPLVPSIESPGGDPRRCRSGAGRRWRRGPPPGDSPRHPDRCPGFQGCRR